MDKWDNGDKRDNGTKGQMTTEVLSGNQMGGSSLRRVVFAFDADMNGSKLGWFNTSSSNEHDNTTPRIHDTNTNTSEEVSREKVVVFGPEEGPYYRLGRRIGSGNYGVVRLGKIQGTRDFVAVKLEEASTRSPTLEKEWLFYTNKIGIARGFPKAHYFGQVTFPDKTVFNGLVISLLDLNLEDLFNFRRRKFSLKTILMIALETLTRIEQLHSHGIIYRDIKPTNFVIGRDCTPEEDIIHLIDFGLCKEYIDPSTGSHRAMAENVPPAGTIRYMSINCHRWREQSRRDDLEALGYLFLYFLLDKLPWSDLKAKDESDRLMRVGQKKESIPIENLCKGLPDEFAIYLKTVRELAFNATPNYEFLKNLFRGLLTKKGWMFDRAWDWKGKLPSNGRTKTSSRTSDKRLVTPTRDRERAQ